VEGYGLVEGGCAIEMGEGFSAEEMEECEERDFGGGYCVVGYCERGGTKSVEE
jgi:hypothetical protein